MGERESMSRSPLLFSLLGVLACTSPLRAQNEPAEAEFAVEILEGRGRSLSAYPFAYYTPETELAFGAGGIVTYYTSRFDLDLRPSKTSISGYYSTRGQYSFSQETEMYFDRNQRLITVPFSFGSLVDKYWGVGNRSADIEADDYDVRVIEGEVVFEGATPLENFARDGLVYRASYRDVLDRKDNPNLTDDVTGVDGGFSSGLGLVVVADSRDQIFWPTEGGFDRLNVVWYTRFFGSEFRFSELDFDFRRYMSPREGQVFAAQLRVGMVFGEAPFYELPAIGGGEIMRGYYQGRFRDESLLAAQVEYRAELFWRLGAVAFAGVGDVFGSDQSDVSFDQLKYSVGGGLRLAFDPDQKINLRMDIGFGRDSRALYFGLEEAF